MRNKRRYVRFSISALLIAMSLAALLLNRLNYERRRADAMDTTINRVHEWHGAIVLRPRPYVPKIFATILPKYWTQEINGIFLALYRKGEPEPTHELGSEMFALYSFVDPQDFEAILDLGALDNLGEAYLGGTLINQTILSRLGKSPELRSILLTDVKLSDDEIAYLRETFPDCDLNVVPSTMVQ